MMSSPMKSVIRIAAIGIGCLVLAAALLWLSLPRSSELALFYSRSFVDRGIDEAGRPWIGSAEPKIVIHEYFDYLCPHCLWSHRQLRRLLVSHWHSVRLVRHDYARTSCEHADPELKNRLCVVARAATCAGRQGRHWEWNDGFRAIKTVKSDEIETLLNDHAKGIGLNLTDFLQCRTAQETFDHVQSVYEETQKNGVDVTPTYIVDGKKMDLEALIGHLQQ